MRTRVRKFAHFLERIGLAMAGAASGLFVAAHTGSTISALASQAFLLIMMIGGAVGFYLGIDTPQLPFDEAHSTIDAAELLSAAGTLCATLTALASVAIIVLRLDPHIAWSWFALFGWIAGIAMQSVAGAKARMRT